MLRPCGTPSQRSIAAMTAPAHGSGFFRRFAGAIGIFLVVLVACEALLGFAFIDRISNYLESERRGEFVRSWEQYVEQRRAVHESKVTGYAWWTAVARAMQRGDRAFIEREAYGSDASIAAEYDVFLAFDRGLAPHYLLVDAHNSIEHPEETAALRDPGFEAELLGMVQARLDELEPEIRAAEAEGRRFTPREPVVWHFFARYGGRVRLFTLSPICTDNGRPLDAGFVLFGYRLDRLAQEASQIIPIRDVRILEEKPSGKASYALIEHEGFRDTERFFVTFEPEISIAGLAQTGLVVFIAAQVLLSALVFAFVAPLFTRRHTRQLRLTIADRTAQLERANSQLERRQKQILQELALARIVQQNLLPGSRLTESNLDLAAYYAPMADLGGDIYDVLRWGDGRLGILLADVAGHGVPAALIAMMVKLSFANHARADREPGETLEAMNRELCRFLNMGDYLTAFYVKIHGPRMTLSYSGAGHRDSLLYSPGEDRFENLPSSGAIIGLSEEARYRTIKRSLSREDRLILFTDGLIEQMDDAQEMYGMQRLKNVVAELSREPGDSEGGVQGIVAAIIRDLEAYRGGEPIEDDVTVVAVRILPPPADGSGAGHESRERESPPPYRTQTPDAPDDPGARKREASAAEELALAEPGATDRKAGDAPAIEIEPDRALERAMELYRAGRYSESARGFQELLAARPDEHPARFNLALALYKLGEYAAAEGELSRYLRVFPASEKGQRLAERLREALN